MAHGWELLFRIAENPHGIGTTVDQTEGIYLEVSEDGLGQNQTVRERDDRMRRGRFAPADSFSAEFSEPGGDLTFIPRSNDIIGIFMSHFQCVDYSAVGTVTSGIGTGTFTFIPIQDPPDWQGSIWGTHAAYVATSGDVFSLRIDKIYGENLETGQYVNNGMKLDRAVVTKVELRQSLGEDLMAAFHCEAIDGDPAGSYGAAFFPNDNSGAGSLGSFSDKTRFVDWMGTVSYLYAGVATTLDIQDLTITLENGQENRRRLGTKNRVRFPYSGRPVHEGRLQWEFDRSDVLDYMKAGGSFALLSTWYEGALNWMQVEQRNCKLRASDPQGGGGDSSVMYEQPYRAYPGGGTPATVIRVCTTFATRVWTFPFGLGTAL